MNRLTLLCLTLFFSVGLTVWAEERGGSAPARPAMASRSASQARSAMTNRPAPQARQPVVINMNHGASGGHNRNFPSQQPQMRSNRQPAPQPSYGRLNWNNAPVQPARPASAQSGFVQGRITAPAYPRPSVQNYAQNGVKAAVAVHHHPYVQGYVRRKLQKIGVNSEPSLITDRGEMINTDKSHSIIRYPQKDGSNQPITAAAVSPRHFNDAVVRDNMNLVNGADWMARVNGLDSTENQKGHYYWHNDDGINYCHYLDPSGYNWYGWYVGSQYFWTRNFDGRWWWYDSDFSRWCFWNNGFWWWQDPNHVGDLYCYDNDNYIPCNSAEDQVVVTAPADAVMHAIPSPDGTRIVKLDEQTQDAFLYDTADPPTFDPVYLASGVESVQFSDTSNGRPMEIILKLNDGSYDLFDAEGNSYDPGLLDADEAKQGDAPPAPNFNP